MERQQALENLRDALQQAEQFGLVRNEVGSPLTCVEDTQHGFVIKNDVQCDSARLYSLLKESVNEMQNPRTLWVDTATCVYQDDDVCATICVTTDFDNFFDETNEGHIIPLR